MSEETEKGRQVRIPHPSADLEEPEKWLSRQQRRAFKRMVDRAYKKHMHVPLYAALFTHKMVPLPAHPAELGLFMRVPQDSPPIPAAALGAMYEVVKEKRRARRKSNG